MGLVAMGHTRDTSDDTPTMPVSNEFDPRTLDTYYRTLADERRRIIVTLVDSESAMGLDELVWEVYKREARTDLPEIIQFSLIHQHIPVLAEAGALEYDRETERVVGRSPVIDDLSTMLECTST